MAAIDSGSISKALLALTAANNMLAANTGQMLVFQPTVINTADEAPRIPQGSLVFYTGAIMQGDILLPPSTVAAPVVCTQSMHVCPAL